MKEQFNPMYWKRQATLGFVILIISTAIFTIALVAFDTESWACLLLMLMSFAWWAHFDKKLRDHNIEYIPEYQRDDSATYTYFRVDFINCDTDFDYTIVEDISEIAPLVATVDTQLDDPDAKACIKITGVGMTPPEFRKFLEDSDARGV